MTIEEQLAHHLDRLEGFIEIDAPHEEIVKTEKHIKYLQSVLERSHDKARSELYENIGIGKRMDDPDCP